jgi:hypothetical protein
MSPTAAALLAALLLAPSPRPPPPALGPPADAAERAERIEVALGMIHGRASPEAWRAMGPEAVADLERIALDPAALPSRRGRALEGLSWIGGARAEAILRRAAAEETLPFSVRAEALRGAGRLLPPAELVGTLRPVLRSASRAVDRAVAAEVLAERAPAAACAEVRIRAGQESAAERGVFWRALERCRARGR